MSATDLWRESGWAAGHAGVSAKSSHEGCERPIVLISRGMRVCPAMCQPLRSEHEQLQPRRQPSQQNQSQRLSGGLDPARGSGRGTWAVLGQVVTLFSPLSQRQLARDTLVWRPLRAPPRARVIGAEPAAAWSLCSSRGGLAERTEQWGPYVRGAVTSRGVDASLCSGSGRVDGGVSQPLKIF